MWPLTCIRDPTALAVEVVQYMTYSRSASKQWQNNWPCR